MVGAVIANVEEKKYVRDCPLTLFNVQMILMWKYVFFCCWVMEMII